MKRSYLLIFIVGLLLVGSVRLTSTAHAAPQATYQLVKSSVGPGGSGSAGMYTVSSSVGQSTAGEVSAGIYTLGGGFWGGGIIVSAQSTYAAYLPLVLR